MRNLTKVLAMVLAFTMMVSVAAFAVNYTDVEASANYAEAVDVLSDLGLVKGYTDGTFGADKTLTRAEAATLVVRLMGLEEAAVAAAGSDTGFTDVAADHWASGYIYMAAQKNVVAGMGDGTFEPDTTLEYAQIVKMITVALGYAPQAAEAGEWPGNYISTASNIGLTKGIPGKATDAASRGLTARLLYSALTIAKMEKNGVGVNAIFEPVNKMILDDLGIIKVLGKVATVSAIDETVTIDDGWKQGVIMDKKYKDTTDSDYVTFDDTLPIKPGVLAAELKELVNVPAYIYLQEDEEGYVVVSIVAKKGISSVEFTSEDIEDYDTTKNKLSVYTNAEQTKTASYKLADSIEVYINGERQDYDDVEDGIQNRAADDFANDITVTPYAVVLMDTNNDTEYDYANLTEFKYMVVDEVKASKQGVYTIKGEDLDLAVGSAMADFKIDTENEDTDITIIKDGEVVDVKAIEEGDILNIVEIESDSDELIQGTIYVTNEKIDGTVRYVNDDETIPVIKMADGKSYKSLMDDTELIASQTEATFYLNISGKIIYMDDEVSVAAYKYAFATNIVLSGKGSAMKTGTIRVLTPEGEWKTLDLKSTFTIDNTPYTISDITLTADTEDTFEALFAHYVEDNREPEFAIVDMIAYKLDSTGAVKAIVVLDDNAIVDGNAFGLTNKTFKADDEEATFGTYLVDETTVIYNFVEDAVDCAFDEADVKVTDISVLTNDKTYEEAVSLYDIDDKTDLVSIMKGSFVADVDFQAPWFIVNSVVKETIDDVEYIVLTGLEAGDEKTYYVSQDDESEMLVAIDDSGVVAEDGTPLANAYVKATYAQGDIFIVNADADGIIAKAVKLGSVYNFVSADGTAFDFTNLDLTVANVDGDDEGWIVAGFAALRNDSKTKIYLDTDADLYDDVAIKAVDGAEYSIKDAKNVTVFNAAAAKKENRLSAGDTSDIDQGTIVLGRCDEDQKLIEVIVIISDMTDTEVWA